MRKICLMFITPRRYFFSILLALGVFFFYFHLLPDASALDAGSSIFTGSSSTSTSSSGDQPLALPEEVPKPSPGLFSTFLRLLLALFFTAALVVLTVWGLKLIWERRGLGKLRDEGKAIKVLSSTYLSPRKTIHLVEVGKRILVLGVGTDEIHRLDVITEPLEIDALRKATQQAFPSMFARILQKQEISEQGDEAEKILEEGNVLVGGYVAKLRKISKKRNDSSQKTDVQ